MPSPVVTLNPAGSHSMAFGPEAGLVLVDAIARQEGRQLQVLIEEALSDLIEKRKQARPRATVMAAYQASHEIFAPLYKKLAE